MSVHISKLVIDSDGRGEAPGNAVFRQVLEEASPCLILLDELVSYLVKLRFSSVRRTLNLYRQTVQFLQETLQLASNVARASACSSLCPRAGVSSVAWTPEQLHNELSIMEELQPRADRVVSKRTPINDEDIYVLMRRRLFEHVDAGAAERVADAYRQVYGKTPGLYEAAVSTPDYLEQQRAAYPLHPELIDVIYKKWSTVPDFPRTRATLQLLAGVVAAQWKNRREAHAIQSAHVDLGQRADSHSDRQRRRLRRRLRWSGGSGHRRRGRPRRLAGPGPRERLCTIPHRARSGYDGAHALFRGNGAERRHASGASPRHRGSLTSVPSTSRRSWARLEETLWYVHK